MRQLLHITLLIGLLWACKKKSDITVPSPDTGTLTEESRIRILYDHLFFATLNVLAQYDTSLAMARTATCDSAVLVDTLNEKYLTAIFGTVGCSFDNVTHTGSLRIDYTGRLSDSGTVITVIPQADYAIGNDGLKPEGIILIKNIGDSAGITRYETGWNDGKITTRNGAVTTFNWSGRRDLVYTNPDTFLNERVYLLSQQNLKGTSATGREFTAVFTALKAKTVCREEGFFQPASGTMSVTNDVGTVSLDFGEVKEDHSEPCDNFVRYTNPEGTSYQVELR